VVTIDFNAEYESGHQPQEALVNDSTNTFFAGTDDKMVIAP
jgi:hypothetical protein